MITSETHEVSLSLWLPTASQSKSNGRNTTGCLSMATTENSEEEITFAAYCPKLLSFNPFACFI